MSNLDDVLSDSMKLIREEQERFWGSLAKEQQLKAFCAVVRRIYQAEINDHVPYRHALARVFGFGPESYAQAQEAGYRDLHSLITDHIGQE